jgi:hypothetical protein
MHIVKTWCENTKEGMEYLKYHKYEPMLRIGEYWLTKRIGIKCYDVRVIL